VKLPLLISVPHAGLTVPEQVRPYLALTSEQIAQASDEGASEIYAIESEVAGFVTTDVACVIVDLNRSPDNRTPDGVVKTHTSYNLPVYREVLTEDLARALLEGHYWPYHRQLTAKAGDAILGVDCHTMSAIGPPTARDRGCERPRVCLSNADGTCSREWLDELAGYLEDEFGNGVSLNAPFKGGHIIRAHSSELPWVQLELSRAEFLSLPEKRARILTALERFCRQR
jgi:formiminoglutamase